MWVALLYCLVLPGFVGGLVGNVVRATTTCITARKGESPDTNVTYVYPGQVDGCSDGITPGPETLIPIDLRGTDEILILPGVGHGVYDCSVMATVKFRSIHSVAVTFDLTGIAVTGASTSLNDLPFSDHDVIPMETDSLAISIALPAGASRQVTGRIIIGKQLPTRLGSTTWGRVKILYR